ncbi:tRNA isopentenyl-2-thiomethyl-A-37 hydroxylase MiaE [Thaumasiovibrio subtropicus]|uniref:tRNA isopentenyl-2-thiomethyl-A-37 hydroxylase MiaE n=1 Tax=Thaumasiovibrio subtropicus TaxID=1891207 RepID=UPI000B35CE91|nr:tRNA isopentenyl-2-thiomethyl-A-37 hydroxylase MiaE [Thaumasiovibrio subtropicus]
MPIPSQYDSLLAPIYQFLKCPTPDAWIEEAAKAQNLPLLLVDHVNCELKAAQTAMLLIRKYVADPVTQQSLLDWLKPYEDFIYRKTGSLETLLALDGVSKSLVVKSDQPHAQIILDKMILLIKEELHHFTQVLEIMEARGIPYQSIRAGRYAKELITQVRTYEPATLIDKLIIGGYIEARSCERFAALAPHLDEELAKFYISLLRSEARHYQDYLQLAELIAGESVQDRIDAIGEKEASLILSADPDFKFHSGLPI